MKGKPIKENAIVIVINQAFAHYAKPLINSIIRNWLNYPTILLFMAPDVSNEHELWFKKIPRLIINRFDPTHYTYRDILIDKEGKFESKAFNDAGFFLLNFWSDILSNYNNILILDADVLVLKNLNNIINNDAFLGVSAANERILPVFSIDKPVLEKYSQLAASYFKALAMGIILPPFSSMNSGVIRIGHQDRTHDKYMTMLEILKKFRNSCIGDQEIIYLWMKKFKKNISFDFRLNFQARFFNGLEEGVIPKRFHTKIKEASKDIHILHFNGSKPDSPDFLTCSWTKNRYNLVDLYNSYL